MLQAMKSQLKHDRPTCYRVFKIRKIF